jgi:hypothetical protein
LVKGGNFELSEASKNTVEKDDEIGAHLRVKINDLAPSVAIKNHAKINPADQ